MPENYSYWAERFPVAAAPPDTEPLRTAMREACGALRAGDEFDALRILEAALLQETGD